MDCNLWHNRGRWFSCLLFRQDFWCYADYKYMAELFEDFPHLHQAVNWSCFGFPERSGDESTIWIGSAEASTPCHIDTYGCNLVAQIYGRKKWTLFPPSETPNLYPTRIPYEESSVFSQVNVTSPDLRRFPAFATVVKYEVIACLGLWFLVFFAIFAQFYKLSNNPPQIKDWNFLWGGGSVRPNK